LPTFFDAGRNAVPTIVRVASSTPNKYPWSRPAKHAEFANADKYLLGACRQTAEPFHNKAQGRNAHPGYVIFPPIQSCHCRVAQVFSLPAIGIEWLALRVNGTPTQYAPETVLR